MTVWEASALICWKSSATLIQDIRTSFGREVVSIWLYLLIGWD
jgi:hypothetical protein